VGPKNPTPAFVDQDVDLLGLPGQIVQLGRVGHVGGDEAGLAAVGGDGVDDGGGAVVPPVHDDFRAVPAQFLGAGPADARGGSGDQCAQPVEVSLLVHVVSSLLSEVVAWASVEHAAPGLRYPPSD
jgi:hypothetical protein